MRSTQIKRVVTGLNSEGKSIAAEVGPAQAADYDWGAGNEELPWGADIWALGHDPVSVFRQADLEEWGGEPPAAGAVFRIVSIPAHGGFPLHKTDTIDFVGVLSGRVWMTFEEGEVELNAQDCVVITGVLHGWDNRDDQPCTICGVLLSTRPPE